MRSNHNLRWEKRAVRGGAAAEALERRMCLSAVSFLPAAFYNASLADALAVGDFNGDGWPDLAVVQPDSVSIWLNQQNGAFAPAQSYSIPGATGVAVGDFNRDGALDLLVTSGFGSTGRVNILFGNGDGTFVTTGESIQVGTTFGGEIISPVVAEFNAFGRADVAVVQHGDVDNGPTGSGGVIVLLNHGDGTFGAPVSYSVGNLNGNFANPTAITVEDYNGDHALDLAVSVDQLQVSGNTSREVPGFVSLLYGNTQPDPNDPRAEIPDGTFTSAFNSAAGVDPDALTTADYNGDGAPDVATANAGNALNPSNVSLFLNDGGGSLVPSGTLIAGNVPQAIVSADFDGNGTSDLAVAGTTGVRVRTGNGNGTFALSQTVSSGGFSQMVVGDFNRDGQPDLAVGNAGGFSILLNNTRPAVVPKVTAASYDYAHSPHSLSFTFNEDVSASDAALNVQNLTSGLAVAPAGYSFDAATHTATFTFAGPLPSGSYRATLLASGVSDSSGIHPVADYPFSFFFQLGDVNHDGKVDFTDLVILARNYGKSSAAYADADLNYDGKVDFSDLVILARHYGQSVPTAAALTPTLADELLTLPLKRRRR